jgi:hypothetical protein
MQHIKIKNNGQYIKSAVNTPILYEGKPIGYVEKVTKKWCHGVIWGAFLPELFSDTGKYAATSISFELSKEVTNAD